MTATQLPPIAGAVLADILDALPARLRKRLDAALDRARAWPIVSGSVDEGSVVVRVDEETTVTVTVRDGAVRTADDVRCDCLLAPGCLHRAALAAIAPVLEDVAEPFAAKESDGAVKGAAEAAAAASRPESAREPKPELEPASEPRLESEPASEPAPQSASDRSPAHAPAVQPLTAAERAAADALWTTGTAVLEAGLVGAGVFTEAHLRRAAHSARAVGLHRASAAAARVGSELRAARDRRDEHSLSRLTADLRELLLVAHGLRTDHGSAADCGSGPVSGPGTDVDALRGTARRAYEHSGGLRLYGLFTEPIVARSGHAGTVTYVLDSAGRLWSTATVLPGDSALVYPSYHAAAGIGGTVQSHRELSRGGLFASGVSASAEGRLSGSAATRAAKAPGAAWTEAPIAGLFDVPFAEQVERALRTGAGSGATQTPTPGSGSGSGSGGGASGSGAGDNGAGGRRVGDDLVFATVRVVGGTDRGLIARLESGETVHCVSALAGHGLAYRRNLSALATPDLALRLIARPDRRRPATLLALAASPIPGPVDLPVPRDWLGVVNLGLDPLPSNAADAPSDTAAPTVAGEAEAAEADTASAQSLGSELPLHLLTHRIEQAVAGGRAVTATSDPRRDAARLHRAALHTGADLLSGLIDSATVRRDAFSRPIANDAYSDAWLAAAVYESAAAEELVIRHWLRACGSMPLAAVG